MSELSELLAGIDRIRLRQSRAIARIVDRQRRSLADPSTSAESEAAADAGYDFAVAVVAAAADRPVEEIEEMAGSILELGPAVARIMEMAGFAAGEAAPAASPGPGGGPRMGSGASMAPSPSAAATHPKRSAA